MSMRAASLLAMIWLTGCTVGLVQPPPAGGPTSTSSPPGADTDARSGAGAELPPPAPPSPVTAALLTQSHDQRDAGDLAGAAATIERGLTIVPDDALLWVELAEIRMREGDADQAEELAQKALTLTSPNSSLAARARRLIRR
jgi:tetratricopeptide (TPR) repeat protein